MVAVERQAARLSLTALKFAMLAALFCAVGIAGLVIGPVPLPLDEVLRALFGGNAPETTSIILWDVRMTRTITALLVGSALGVTGLMMQTIFRNPLADPYVLGILGFGAWWGLP